MKKRWLTIITVAALICVFAATAWASEPIKLVVNGQEIKTDVSPQIIGDRTMVPVRWIAEALGAEVQWDAQSKTVFISMKTPSSENQDSNLAAVIKLTEDFGKKMKNVSLLAPEDIAAKSIQENYAGIVSPALLAQWRSDLQNAPGRLTSSPWPERIEIIGTEKLSDFKYQVKGEIIEVTSVELANGGYAAKRPITLAVEKLDNSWLITAVKLDDYQEDPALYKNMQYGFSFQLPDSWKGYLLTSDQWKGFDIGTQSNVPVETGPLFSIRHPQWTAENPRQDIPIMTFTLSQWDSLQQREFHIGAAPIRPKELGRNSKYVFALPARYNFAFPTGYEEVEQILENNALQTIETAIIQPELAKKIIEETASLVLNALSTKDAKTIAEFTHPTKGIRLTPYTYVSPERDLVFSPEEIKNIFSDQKVYMWGYYDGSGEDINLTPSQYYEKFIYARDYINAEQIGYNEVLSSGNMLENQFVIYDNSIVVEYYFPGFNPDYDGIDWRSLRLVFEPYENDWKLVGIINNQWTI